MKNYQKYEKSYFMPPEVTYDWAKKDSVEQPPKWCSVDLRDGNQALIEPMSLDEKLEFFQMLVDIGGRGWITGCFRDRISVYENPDRKRHDSE